MLGEALGDPEADPLGDTDGDNVAPTEGETDGDTEGETDADTDGDTEDETDGDTEGDVLGDTEGDVLGDVEGETEGETDGETEGEALAEAETLGEGVGAAQSAWTMTLVSRVTAPFLAMTRPATTVPVCTDTEVNAITVPMKLVLVPSVAELPTCQNTLQAWAPLIRETVAFEAVIKVDPAWKMNAALGSPWASRVTVPVRPSAEALL
jgi:hypothetical protein